MSNQLLLNRRILVTRGASQAGKLSDGLREFGAVAIEVPVIEIVPPDSYDALDQALSNLAQYDWLILTSANTVRILAERIGPNTQVLQGSAPQQGIAAIGSATEKAAREAGLNVTVTPQDYVAEGLVELLKDKVAGKRVLLARAAVARDVVPDALREAGAIVDIVDAYSNVLPAAAPQQLRHAFARGIDAVTFASSSSVMHLAEAAQVSAIPFPFPYVPAISIGPITSKTLSDLNWKPAVEADPHDIEGLLAAVVRFFTPVPK